MKGSEKQQRNYLEEGQLLALENSFRHWAQIPKRSDVRLSRRRILVIFLLIRYTGAKLNEVLSLVPADDFDFPSQQIVFKNGREQQGATTRKVHISEHFANELRKVLDLPECAPLNRSLDVDPAFVRKKFYERAGECGFDKQLGGPEMIRGARAAELMRGNLPMPAVQEMLGQSTPNLTSAYVTFTPTEIEEVTRLYIEREAKRSTSARNSFFGKIKSIQRGQIQATVTLATIGGNIITTMITNNSLENLGLTEGKLVTAEVKAPWVVLHKSEEPPASSGDNRLSGTIERINRGRISTEYTILLADGTSLCSVVSTESSDRLGLRPRDQAWAIFNCFAVILHVD